VQKVIEAEKEGKREKLKAGFKATAGVKRGKGRD